MTGTTIKEDAFCQASFFGFQIVHVQIVSKKRDLTYYEHMLIIPVQGEADAKTEVLQTDRRHAPENLFPS
jgi:hypothetical protein